jgi:hypothetical protein
VLGAHDESVAEWALSSAAGEAVATHVIDRSFVAGGTRWIIDYKTARIPAGTTLRRHAERYREQLERYAALFRADGLPIRIAVFYAAQGELIELRRPESGTPAVASG